jgi:hypothetical protein
MVCDTRVTSARAPLGPTRAAYPEVDAGQKRLITSRYREAR